MRKNTILILAFLWMFPLMLLGECIQTKIEAEATSNEEQPLKIVAFGNSITAIRNTIDQVFAQRLPSLLMAEGIKAEVINSGIPGSHTGSIKDHDLFKIKHARDRFETDVLAHEPDLVIIGFGTNDAHIDGSEPDGQSRIPLKQYKRNLKCMIKELQNIGVDVILIAPNGLRGKYPEYQNVRLGQYVEVVKKLSVKYNTGLVDNFKLFSAYYAQDKSGEELLLDGVHPNDKGHALMAENLCMEIVRMKVERNK